MDGDTLLLFPSGRLGTFKVPETVNILGSNSFNFTALDSLNIGENIVDIGEGILLMALNMRSFRYPNSIKRVERRHQIWGYNLDEVIYGSETEYVYGNEVVSKYLSRIVCLATTPPEVGLGHIKGSDTLNLYVPRNSIELYKCANEWNHFLSIRPIEPPIVTGVNNAEVSWVQNFSATGYVWTLYLDEAHTQRFMSLTFDENGHLTSIDFGTSPAPRHAPALYNGDGDEETRFAEYYSFTISGLTAGTKYYYTRQSLNGTEVIDEEFGSFETLSSTNLDEIEHSASLNSHKVIENGQIYILHENEKYSLDGACVSK